MSIEDAVTMQEEAFVGRFTTAGRSFLRQLAQPVMTVAVALLIGLLVIIAIGADPFQAYSNFLFGSFESELNFGNLLARATPLIVTALGVVVAFRAGIFNIGGEGQMYLGAFWGAVAGFTFVDLPGPLLVLVVMIVAAIAGGLWAAIAGFLKARWDVDEVVSTILLNYVALLLTEYLVNNAFKDVTAGSPATVLIAPQAWLPGILPPSTATVALPIAVVLGVATWFILFRTVWGARVRSVGTNRRFAQAVGVGVRVKIVQAMFLSGALAGIAGGLEVMGVTHRFYQGFSPGFGFLGLTVALLGKLNPWGALAVGFFYAALLNGAAVMQLRTDVPYPFVSILAGIIVLVMTAQARPRLGRLLGRRGAVA